MKRVVIVGAGISGLSLAFRLRGVADVTVLEASNRVGGCVCTERADGFTVEYGPNGFLDSKPSTVALACDVGLGDELQSASEASRKHRFLLLGGKLRELPGSVGSFIRSPLLSVRGKLALLAEPLRAKRRGYRPESVAAFARRRGGREAADLFADALVTGIHGGDPALLDVRAAFPRLVGFEANAGSVVRGMNRAAKERRAAGGSRPQTWAFRNGLQTLIDALAERVKVVTGACIRRVETATSGWSVVGEGRDRWDGAAVVLTCPAYVQATLLNDLDGELATLLGGISYNRIAVVALGYRATDVRPVEGFGFIAPQATRRDVLGVQWCSSIFPGRAPDGCVLWRALCGGWHRADVVSWSDDDLIAAVRRELRLAQSVTAQPVFDRVVRWERAIPQYMLGHPERVDAIEARAARHPGLFVAGNALHGVALNDCTERAESLTSAVAEFLSAQH